MTKYKKCTKIKPQKSSSGQAFQQRWFGGPKIKQLWYCYVCLTYVDLNFSACVSLILSLAILKAPVGHFARLAAHGIDLIFRLR